MLSDLGAAIMAGFLRLNTGVVSLKCDNNKIGQQGWQCIACSFVNNKTLQMWEFPWIDYGWFASQSSSKLPELRDTLLRIEGANGPFHSVLHVNEIAFLFTMFENARPLSTLHLLR